MTGEGDATVGLVKLATVAGAAGVVVATAVGAWYVGEVTGVEYV